ncbi:hypothetical protein X943_001560 [Babesia divergens]|uniref:Uncharacterized protein n=1 Tax=Babesia divergens TaxID=32595 RepID=A0AAD9G6X1_BABDI|nr:hypothetical protein X943_001560 [Babesia divergens]
MWLIFAHLCAVIVTANVSKDGFRRCTQLSPRSLGIGQYCLSLISLIYFRAVRVCVVTGWSATSFISYPSRYEAVLMHCGNGMQRFVCISTPPSPHGYPLCNLLDSDYYTDSSAACWTSCIEHKCPGGMVAKNNHRTNFGCFDSNTRLLCVP